MKFLVIAGSFFVIVICALLLFHASRNSARLIPMVLSPREYARIKTELLSIVDTQDPRAAIEKLKKEMETDPNARGFCHELLHETGRYAYLKYKDFATALKYRDEVCVAGYIHGVIEGYFKNSNDLFTSVKTVCEPYHDEKYEAWECYHGVGHGLMYYTNNNVPASLDYCGSYNTPFARSACANGVFMENFNADRNNHPSKFLSDDNEFYPCDVYSFKSDCYMNAPVRYLARHDNDYPHAFKWCHGAGENESDCVYGVASQMTRRNMGKTGLIEKMCNMLSKPLDGVCIKSMVVWYVTYYGRLTEAETLCATLARQNAPLCRAVVQAYRAQF